MESTLVMMKVKETAFLLQLKDLVTKHRELQNDHDMEISKCYLPSLILKQRQ